jgi:hypothetical protein
MYRSLEQYHDIPYMHYTNTGTCFYPNHRQPKRPKRYAPNDQLAQMIEYGGGIPPVLGICIIPRCGSSGGSSSSLAIFYIGWVVILEEEKPARQPITCGGGGLLGTNDMDGRFVTTSTCTYVCAFVDQSRFIQRYRSSPLLASAVTMLEIERVKPWVIAMIGHDSTKSHNVTLQNQKTGNRHSYHWTLVNGISMIQS